MPLIGLTLGSSLAHAIGDIADYLVAAAVIDIGAWMLAHGDEADEQAAGRLLATRGTAIIASASASAWTSWRSGSASAWSACPSSR